MDNTRCATSQLCSSAAVGRGLTTHSHAVFSSNSTRRTPTARVGPRGQASSVMQILKPRDDAAEISAGIVDPVHGGVEPCHHVLGQDDDVGRSVGRQELREQVEHGVRALRVRARAAPADVARHAEPCRQLLAEGARSNVPAAAAASASAQSAPPRRARQARANKLGLARERVSRRAGRRWRSRTGSTCARSPV
jgi:hypothetical protein